MRIAPRTRCGRRASHPFAADREPAPTHPPGDAMDRAGKELVDRIREAGRRGGARSGAGGIARVEVAIPRVDALTWLRAHQAHPVRMFWSDRDGAREVAGVGAADVVARAHPDDIDPLFGRLRRRLAPGAAGPRYFGGLRFNHRSAPDAAWRTFGAYRFVLPRFELTNRRRDPESVLACQWLRSEQDVDALVSEVRALALRPPANGVEAVATRRMHLPDRAEWDHAVARTLDTVSAGGVDKLVLARKSTFEFDAEIDPLACLQTLRPWAARCYRFCFVPAPGRAFLGVSPERLYRREGARIRCEAMAGTRLRGDRASLDRRLERCLMDSEKDRREHGFVVRGLQESLADLCRSLTDGAGVSVVKLRQCQHLARAFRGVLRAGVGDAELVKALHPTPAVGGYPSQRSVRHIEETEAFDRGWYAGPVGWVGRDAAEFAVAIRSGLVQGSTLSVFAGAGIVAGSDPASEWRELDCKMRHFTDALNLPS